MFYEDKHRLMNVTLIALKRQNPLKKFAHYTSEALFGKNFNKNALTSPLNFAELVKRDYVNM